ncbi:MAG TPA: ASCH domain-containing protein [Gemmataceae bacterium]|nr:ASCH domain-containing protein [Gemmataceae bacterium]
MAGPRRTLTINQANLDHGHIYLTGCIDIFPADVMGGPNKATSAPSSVQIDFGSGQVTTDVVSKRKIFRSRGWVRRFFAENNLTAGDSVVLEQVAPYSYRISAEPLELTCLSIQQPWVDLILDGKKQIENRTWPWTGAQELLKAGKKVTLGIHVSSSLNIWRSLTASQRQLFAPGWSDAGVTGGVVVGIVDVVRVCQWNELPPAMQRHKYTLKEFAWHWELTNPRRLLTPVRWPGNASLFKVSIPRHLLPAGAV